MSRQFVFGAVGAVVGFIASGFNPAGAQYGFVIGSTIGAITAPDVNTEGPRPDDSKLPGASEGDPIPYVEGTARVAGVVAWASAKRVISTTTSQGGKGPDQNVTTYSEEIDVLILLTCNQMAAVRRIWAYGKLEWSIADDADAQTLADSQTTGLWRAIRFYTGAPGQLPDPTYEAAVGVGNAPAYPGRSYVAIDGLQLQSGSQLPVLNFEVCSAATLNRTSIATWTVSQSGTDGTRDGSGYCGSLTFRGGSEPLYFRNNDGDTDLLDISETGDTLNAIEPTVVDIDYSAYPSLGNQGAVWVGVGDQPCIITHAISQGPAGPSGFGIVLGFIESLGLVAYEFIEPQGINGLRYALRGGAMYLAPTSSGTRSVFRFAAAGGTELADSAVFTDFCTGLAVNDEFVFFMEGGDVHTLDPITLIESGSAFAAPGGDDASIIVGDDDELYAIHASTLYLRNFDTSTWDIVGSISGTISGNSTSNHPPVMRNGSLYFMSHPGNDPVQETFSYTASITAAPLTVPLSDVMDRLAARTGQLQPADYDHSALAGIDVRGMVVNRSTSTRAVMEMLQRGYLFEQVEGDIIKAVPRGGSTVATLPYDDLGTSEGESPAEPLPIRRLNDIEQAARVTVKYLNAENDFQTGAATGDRLITDSTAEQTLELALAFTPQEAKRLADVYTMDIAVGLTTLGPVAFGRKYRRLESTDPIGLTNSDGSVYRARILKITDSGDVRVAELVADDATIINSLALTDSNYTPQTLVRGSAPTEAVFGDWPLLRDSDDTPGYYAVATAVGRWGGARIVESADDVQFSELVQITERAVLGRATTALGDWTWGFVVDETNSVTVDVGDGELSSATDDAILADDTLNAMAIGDHGRWELIQFKNATLVGAGVYTLSGLLRGRKGTEWAVGTHAGGDTVVLLQPAGMRRIEEQQADIGLLRYLRAVSIGRQLDSATSEQFVNAGVSQKPYAPVDLAVLRDASGNIAATWNRRSRLSFRFLSPVPVPLGETTEAYAVEVYDDDTFTTVVRTETVTAPAFSYSAADQTSDFGSPQAEVHLRVYQLSAQVGRGYELEGSA